MPPLLQTALLAPGPFFFYPWKAVINALVGDSYVVAYKHFQAGHRHRVNLLLHFVCLWIQASSNFCLLNTLDKALWGDAPGPFGLSRPLSALSAATWVIYLATASTGCPAICSLLSALTLGAVYIGVPFIPRPMFDTAAVLGMVAMLIASNVTLPASRRVPLRDAAKVVIGLPLLFFMLFPRAESFFGSFGGSYEQHKWIAFGTVAYLAVLASLKNPLKPLVISATFVCRFAAYATAPSSASTGVAVGTSASSQLVSDGLFYLGYAFIASLFQGLTHQVTREEATLLALERQHDEMVKVRYEFAHVTFFPNLLFHAMKQYLF